MSRETEIKLAFEEYSACLDLWDARFNQVYELDLRDPTAFDRWSQSVKRLEEATTLAQAKYDALRRWHDQAEIYESQYERDEMSRDAFMSIRSGVVANWAAFLVSGLALIVAIYAVREVRPSSPHHAEYPTLQPTSEDK